MSGARLDSAATAGEGRQNYLCAAQAAAVLTGLLTTSIWFGGWWTDPASALAIAGWAIYKAIPPGAATPAAADHDPAADPNFTIDCPLWTVCHPVCHSTPVARCHG